LNIINGKLGLPGTRFPHHQPSHTQMSLLALLMGNSSPLEDQPSSTVYEPGISAKLQKAFTAIDSFSRDKDYFCSLDDEQLKEAHLQVRETVSSLGSLGQWITKTLRKQNAKPSLETINLIDGSPTEGRCQNNSLKGGSYCARH